VKKTLVVATRFIGIGWYIGLCIVGGFFLGRWVGRKLEFEAFFSLLGLGVGILMAAYGIWAGYTLMTKKGQSNNEDEEK